MRINFKFLLPSCVGLLFSVVTTMALSAQTAPAYVPPAAPVPNSTLASMNEDIQMLTTKVSQLSLQIQNLQQENDNLRNQVITAADVNAAVQNSISKFRDETNKAINQAVTTANADLRKEIVAEITRQIEALARDTNAQLQTLAQAIGKPPSATTRVTPADPNKPPQDFGPGEVYVVKPGESLSKIASRFKVSVGEIEKANNLTPADANKIREGQQLFIPLPNAAQAPVPVTPAPAN